MLIYPLDRVADRRLDLRLLNNVVDWIYAHRVIQWYQNHREIVAPHFSNNAFSRVAGEEADERFISRQDTDS